MVISLIVVLGLIPMYEVEGAIDLLYFRATSGEHQIKIQWATATELNTSGFYVLRSLSEESGYIRISSFIFAKGDSLSGGEYEFLDVNVLNGVNYWYLLEEVDTNQGSSLHGPEHAIPLGPTITPSPTPTITLTSTPTIEPTSSPIPRTSPQPTATVNPQPADDNYPLPIVDPDNPIEDLSVSQENDLPGGDSVYPAIISETENVPVTELLPFPSITIEFPAITETNVVNMDKEISLLQSNDTQEIDRANGRTFILITLGAVWFFLMIWVLKLFRNR